MISVVFPTDPSSASRQNITFQRIQAISPCWIRAALPSRFDDIAFGSASNVADAGYVLDLGGSFGRGWRGWRGCRGGGWSQDLGTPPLITEFTDHSSPRSVHGMHERKTMNRRDIGGVLRLGAGALLMWVAGQAFATFPATDAERAVLPVYCKDTMGFAGYGDQWGGNASPLAKSWVAKMGQTFWAMHHYCVGLVKRNRALRPGVPPVERKYLIESAISEYYYVLNNLKDQNFILLPEIYTRIGEAQLVVSNPGAADKAFARARAIKPDYWPAYSRWADYLMQTGKQADAKQLVKTGLQQAPNANMLIEQYRLLGGKPSEIVPVAKARLAEQATDDQSGTSDANSETDDLPVESDLPDE